VGSTEQTKIGNLIVEGVLRLGQFTTANAPSGTEGALYFDTTENKMKLYSSAAWADLGGGAALWTQSGNDIFYNNGDVGIGTSTPGALLHVAGTGKFSGSLDMTSQRITNLAVPTTDSDAVTKAYVDAAGSSTNWYAEEWTHLGDGRYTITNAATLLCGTVDNAILSYYSSWEQTGYTFPSTTSEIMLCITGGDAGSCGIVAYGDPPYDTTKSPSVGASGGGTVLNKLVSMIGVGNNTVLLYVTSPVTTICDSCLFCYMNFACTTRTNYGATTAGLLHTADIGVATDLSIQVRGRWFSSNAAGNAGSQDVVQLTVAGLSKYSYSIWYK